ncbi:potassium channel family protein [Halomarina oriensis]|uniref:TrkA family potassium uptake protein n=1 Tax=Halomarina oriensis TaxID=671145 RepID=A0A6B0GHC0_9EURY|nr:TrkA family potassium uptake protein [Halomarina oriensis]MWG34256.1 TrkA family potassium uptake protein [Halomarina oriensis]
MKFVIAGYGRVGIRTADILGSEGHDVTIVDNDPEKVERAESAGFDAFFGEGDDEETLREAGLETADALGGLTGDLNTNLSACVIGDAYDCRTVMRIDDDYHADIYEKYAAEVDEVIYPERLGAAGAKTALLGGDFDVLGDLTESLSAASVVVGADADVVGQRVVEVEVPDGVLIYAHGSANEPMTIPLPQTEIGVGDEIAFIAEPDLVASVRAQLSGEAAL